MIDPLSHSQVLSHLETQFAVSARALARACGGSGSLDAQQGAAFEIAWVKAELQAARALASATAGYTPAQWDMANAFIAETTTSVLVRLQSIQTDLGMDPSALHDLAGAPALARLRSASGSSRALARVGQAVIDAPETMTLRCDDPDIVMARDSFERFATAMVTPLAQAIHRDDLTVPESVLQPLREMGAFGLSIPQEYGGSATGGIHDNALTISVTETLSEASLAAAGSLITRPEILARALLAGGTAEQKERWLPRIASGALLCAIAITEPDYGSDVASLTLAATRTTGGWALHGAKAWCTLAGKAELLMVVARTDRDRQLGHRGLSVFLVEKPSFDGHGFCCTSPGGGTLSGKSIPTLGYRGMHSFDLAFDGFVVPEANLIGGEAGLGNGFYYTMAGMTGGRLQTAGRACGVMRAAIKAAIKHARDRNVFGASLATYQLTQIKLGRMAARYFACRQLAEATARSADRPTHAMEASLAKLLACRSAEMVTREALQIHGAMGYAEETPVSRLFVDARVLSIFEGAEETLALKVIARSILDSHMEAGKA